MNQLVLLCNNQLAAARISKQLAPLILHLSFVENALIPTMGVTASGVVHYNPGYVAKSTSIDLQKCILHEALHLFLDYFVRQQARDSHRWNVAHDLEISHYVVPTGGIEPGQFQLPLGKGAEFYYDHLKGTNEPSSQCSQGQIAPGPANAATHRAIVRTAEEIVKNACGGDQAGRGDGLLQQALKIIAPTSPNNQLRQIQGAMFNYGLSDLSYERPNRRTSHMRNIILPANIHREPRVLCILDVSGSMQQKLEPATGAIIAAVKSIGTSLDVVAWDTRPRSAANVRSKADIAKLCYTGGGTDMAAAILSAPSRGKFDAILVVTDCETEWPTREEARKLPPVFVLNVSRMMKPPTYFVEIQA